MRRVVPLGLMVSLALALCSASGPALAQPNIWAKLYLNYPNSLVYDYTYPGSPAPMSLSAQGGHGAFMDYYEPTQTYVPNGGGSASGTLDVQYKHIDLYAYADSQSIGGDNGHGIWATASGAGTLAISEGSWTDQLKITGATQGTHGTLSAIIGITAERETTTGEPMRAAWSASLAGSQGGGMNWGWAPGDNGAGVYYVTLGFWFGEWFNVSMFGSAGVNCFANYPDSNYSRSDLTGSLDWNGIAWVKDSAGNTLTDYSLASGSGTDYRYAVVPEPSSILALGSGMLALAGAMWRRRR